ncbi:MAG: hypothetical protein PF570_05720 [Candidatus Cloacimonetes bacterium]|jgi:hypothetical protein|nr:hypothetical protein [Candidatus Cloacimonadota bacterium]
MKNWLILIIAMISFSELNGEVMDTSNNEMNDTLINKLCALYSHDFTETSRLILFAPAFKLSSHYVIENSGLNLSWERKDFFNNKKTNVSIIPILDLALTFYQAGFNRKSIARNPLFFPSFLINSSHYFLLKKGLDRSTHNLQILPALFIKNNTDLFILHKNNWFQLSPGIGTRLYFGRGLMYWTLDVGYQKKFKFIFDGRQEIEDSIFFSIGWYFHFE